MPSQGIDMPAAPVEAPAETLRDMAVAGGIARPGALPESDAARPATAGASPRASLVGTLAPFLPAVAAAIALAVHRLVPSQQTPDPTRLYPRFLLAAIAFGVFLGLTQRLWRPMKVTFARLPLAVPSNVLHWCIVNAPILAAG